MLRKHLDDNPLVSFKPNPMQERFFRSKAQIRLLVAGNRSGKTMAGVAEDCAAMVGYRPWVSPKDPDFLMPIKPPVKIRIVAQDFETAVRENLTPEFERWFPNLLKRPDFHITNHPGTRSIGKIVHKTTKSKAYFLTHKQEASAEGGTFDYLHVDEPCPESLWKASRRGIVTKGGYAWFTLTPVLFGDDDQKYNAAKNIGWLYDKLYSRAAEGSRIECIQGSLYDNLGFGVTEQNIQDFISDLHDEDEIQCRIYGKFTHLAGVVFKEYLPNVHVKSAKDFPAESKFWPRYIGIDPHPEKGQFAVFHMISPEGNVWVYDCCHVPDAKTLAEEIKVREPHMRTPEGRELCCIVIDPTWAFKGAYAAGADFVSVLMSNGILCPIIPAAHGPGSLQKGIDIVKTYLREPRVFYHEANCKPLLHEFSRYIWAGDSKPLSKFNDFIDAHRAVLQHGPHHYITDFVRKSLDPWGREGTFNRGLWENGVGLI